MLPLYVLFVTGLRFTVLLYAKAENLAPGNGESGLHLSNRAVRIRCPAGNFAFENLVQLTQSARDINLSQQKKSDDNSFDSSSFLNHVIAVNSQIYKCNSPIVEAPRRIFSRARRGLDEALSKNAPSLNTDLNVMFDCLTTRHTITPDSGRKSVVILSSNSPELWEFSKLVTGDDCQLVSLNSYTPLIKEPKFRVQGSADEDDIVYKMYEQSTPRGPGRRRKDAAIPPVRPRIVQQSERRVQIEWRNPHKGVPVDYYRVQYMKDDGKEKWLPCHEGNLGSRVRSFRFDDLMLFRRYKFRIYAHYENDDVQCSAPTTWFKLEKWE